MRNPLALTYSAGLGANENKSILSADDRIGGTGMRRALIVQQRLQQAAQLGF